MQGDMQTFHFFNFQLKRYLCLMQRTMKQKEIKQSTLKVMRTKIKQVGYNFFNQELNYLKEKKDKHS
jgi:hypothetical protein